MTKRPTGTRQQNGKLQVRIKDPNRGWVWKSTGLLDAPENYALAAEARRQAQAMIDTGDTAEALSSDMTVADWSRRWLKRREQRGVKTVSDDRGRLKNHVLCHPLSGGKRFGDLRLADVRPRHCRDLARDLLASKKAPRTIINIHSVARSLFDDAVSDELISSTPWVIPKYERPKKRDKDPRWRNAALYSRDEMGVLLFDERVEEWHRVFTALMYLGAMRFGEAAARRWGDVIAAEPLDYFDIATSWSTKRGVVDETKTQTPRRMPIHPTLGVILEQWWAEGWERYQGRKPTEDDLIVPARRGGHLRSNHHRELHAADLETLGFRHRTQHDYRRTLVSHASDDGAGERLEDAVWGKAATVRKLYDIPMYKAVCHELLKLDFAPPVVSAWYRGKKDEQKQSLKKWRRRESKTTPGGSVAGHNRALAAKSLVFSRDAEGLRGLSAAKRPEANTKNTKHYEPPAVVLDFDVFRFAKRAQDLGLFEIASLMGVVP
ncbi:MAG: hypothetical protein AAFQ82_12570 [Myxococcota bacterium]